MFQLNFRKLKKYNRVRSLLYILIKQNGNEMYTMGTLLKPSPIESKKALIINRNGKNAPKNVSYIAKVLNYTHYIHIYHTSSNPTSPIPSM